MRKKIMVAEQSDAIRSIAESILHQNGYDVITASTVGKAKEFIIAASPNMIIIGADMKDDNGKYLYDLLEESEQTSSIPLLLIADPDGRSISYPDEVILPRPFDQKDFLERVQLFVGGGAISESGQVSETKPSASMAVDDELLDAALGLDNIEVEDSEVLDKTSTGIKITRQQIEKQKKKDIYELHQPQDEPEENKSAAVESLMIREDSDDPHSEKSMDLDRSNVSESSKLEVDNDQYGMGPTSETSSPGADQPVDNHDYDWFIDEMKKGKAGDKKSAVPGENDSGKLHKTSTADVLQPVTPPPPNIKEGGVEQFISDFKKEIEQIHLESPVEPTSKAPTPSPVKAAPVTIDPAEIRKFCNDLVNILAEKLARKITDKIDQELLYNLIKEDMVRLISEKEIDPPL